MPRGRSVESCLEVAVGQFLEIVLFQLLDEVGRYVESAEKSPELF